MSDRQRFDAGLLLAFCAAAGAYVVGLGTLGVIGAGLVVMLAWALSEIIP